MKKLRPHQLKAISELDNGKILYGGVGTGKTMTALGYYVEKEAPRDLYVITTAKKRDDCDWQYEALQFGMGARDDWTVEGLGRLVVDSWQNIAKYKDVEGAFFIFDEQKLSGSGAWVKAFLRIVKSNRWIMLTATPGDVWMDYVAVFIANGFYKNKTAFVDQHVIYKPYMRFPVVQRYVGTGTLLKHRRELLVAMPYERHTERKIEVIPCQYDEALFEKVVDKRWHVYEERPLKAVSELFSVMRKVVNSSESRIQAVQSLMEKHPKLIVFYNFDYELKMLRELGESLSTDSSSLSTDCTQNEVGSDSVIPTESVPKTDSREDEQCQTNSDGMAHPQSSKRSSGELPETNTIESFKNKTSKRSTTNQTSTPENSFVIAEWNGHKHEPVPKTDSWVYLVQYQAGAEGWNCIDTDSMVFYSLTYSYKNWFQAFGRIDRLNTPFKTLNYYVLKSDSTIDRGIWRALKAKKDFNERDFGAI